MDGHTHFFKNDKLGGWGQEADMEGVWGGGKYDQNMFFEVLKELIETENVKSKHLFLKDRL